MVMKGITYTYRRSLRIVLFTLLVLLDKMFRSVSEPARMGSTPNGSGELRSLNHRKPSLKIAGFLS